MFWITVSAIELGMWLGWLGTKIGPKERTRSRLLGLAQTQATIPMIDSLLAKDYKDTDKLDRAGARYLVKVVHTLSNYRAFEMLVASVIHAKRKGMPRKIKIHLP